MYCSVYSSYCRLISSLMIEFQIKLLVIDFVLGLVMLFSCIYIAIHLRCRSEEMCTTRLNNPISVYSSYCPLISSIMNEFEIKLLVNEWNHIEINCRYSCLFYLYPCTLDIYHVPSGVVKDLPGYINHLFPVPAIQMTF